MSDHLQERLRILLNADFDKRITRMYVMQDLQIAVAHKNKKSEPNAAFQLLDAFIGAEFIKDFPGILRLAIGMIEGYNKSAAQNLFDIKDERDILDCEIASCLLLGSHSSDEHHPVDVVTLEETTKHVERVIFLSLLVKSWNEWMKTIKNRKEKDYGYLLKLRHGTIYYLKNDDTLRLRRCFHAAELRNGATPRLPD